MGRDQVSKGYYFLLPLPQPLPLPDKVVFTFSGPSRLGPFDRTPETMEDGSIEWFVSIAHYHSPKSPEPERQLRRLASEVMPWAFSNAPTSLDINATNEWIGRQSVVEAVVLGCSYDDSDEEKECALLLAIDSVNALARTLHLTTRQPQQLLALPLLPPLILGASASLGEARPPICLNTFEYQNDLSLDLRGQSKEVDERVFSEAWEAVAQNHPLLRYLDLMREARWAAEGEGNHWSAVVTTAAASELLLTTTLQLLTWEEGLSPAEARSLFPERPEIGSRMTALSRHLGGDWNGKGRGAVGNWMRRVAHTRNAALHQGREVSAAEAHEAFDAVRKLERHIADRLANDRNLSRFPRSALALMGVDGLKRAARFTARIQRTIPSLSESFARFGRWRDVVSGPVPDAPAEHLPRELLAVIAPSGALYWILTLSDLTVACPAVLIGQLPEAQARSIRVTQRSIAAAPPPLPVSVWVAGGSDAARPSGAWRPAHELLPLRETMVEGQDVSRSLLNLSPDIQFATQGAGE